jgi:hypothetical protein
MKDRYASVLSIYNALSNRCIPLTPVANIAMIAFRM